MLESAGCDPDLKRLVTYVGRGIARNSAASPSFLPFLG